MNARDQFGLPGAYFPHSAYPVPSEVNPYPAPPWGYEICETPWTVQSLWWQYLYTLDEAYLRRVYPLLRAAGDFLTAYVKRGADGKYHIGPSVSPENWGATVDFRLNEDVHHRSGSDGISAGCPAAGLRDAGCGRRRTRALARDSREPGAVPRGGGSVWRACGWT